jgi:hypothetical protein
MRKADLMKYACSVGLETRRQGAGWEEERVAVHGGGACGVQGEASRSARAPESRFTRHFCRPGGPRNRQRAGGKQGAETGQALPASGWILGWGRTKSRAAASGRSGKRPQRAEAPECRFTQPTCRLGGVRNRQGAGGASGTETGQALPASGWILWRGRGRFRPGAIGRGGERPQRAAHPVWRRQESYHSGHAVHGAARG